MISLLLHESEEKPKTNADNKYIIKFFLGYNLAYIQLDCPNKCLFYE